ncbi:FtsX-like permease family protein [Kitasatospora sp. NPDC051170]|uniref:ABC transporter permease n=1 Tax=Kitasatospora sp. NPDC051170 TaxID=3364056 RepID=UPI00379FFD3B
MIALGLRLSLRGGREALARLFLIAVAVALGTGLLLTCLAGMNAVNKQNTRYAWLETGLTTPPTSTSENSSADSTTAANALWWRLTGDNFDGQIIGRVDLAATGPNAPLPPGIPHLPEPGQYYASPALAALIHTAPVAQLSARFPGHQVGTIGPAALPAPDSLIIIVGRRADELMHAPHARQITAIQQQAPMNCSNCGAISINADQLKFVLAVAALALFFPTVIFIGTATRLAATRREQRFAAMRLVGATPRQVTVLASVESIVAATAGLVVGFSMFLLLRPVLASIPFTGTPFYTGDLTLSPAHILLVVLGVPIGALSAALVALRRVRISPLGVVRRVTPRPPRWWRVIPLLTGMGELSYVVGVGRPATINKQIMAYLPGILLIMGGLIVAGPWLTMIGARAIARRTSRPSVLVAGRRLADNPQAAFRAVSGLIIALFVTTMAIGTLTTFVAHRGVNRGGQIAADTITHQFGNQSATGEQKGNPVPSVPDTLLTELRSIQGVQGVTLIHANPLDSAASTANGELTGGLVSCAELATTPVLGRCAAGAQAAAIGPEVFDPRTGTLWPAAPIEPDRLKTLPVWTIVVSTNGSKPVIEQVRTMLETAYPDRSPFPATMNEVAAKRQRDTDESRQLANVMILTSLPIAGCSLAVSVAAGLADRKRPFSLLRLTGIPLGVLRQVVLLESAVPLLAVAVLATGTGFLAAHLFVKAQLGYSLQPPGIEYYVIVLTGLIASLAVIASTFPFLRRITGPEVARND